MNNYLIIGLGSMGKRRVKCLISLGIKAECIFGMDQRSDRCEEAKSKYGINIVKDESEIDFSEIKAVIVSLPPDKHIIGVRMAIKYEKPVFVEASVVLEDVQEIKRCNTQDVFIAPSCTFIYHPMIKEIKKIVSSLELGKVCDFSYHSGQYLPDWHPWEDIKDFYVSNRVTGGAREIVAYELTWMVDIFGLPVDVKGYFRKTSNLNCDIEDSYACVIDYGDKVGTLIVDVVGRYAARNLIINFEKGQIQWRWDKEQLEIYNAETGKWTFISQPAQLHENGYNKNIGENMYIEEIEAFIKGIDKRSLYINTVEKDIEILNLLNKIEESDGGFNRGK